MLSIIHKLFGREPALMSEPPESLQPSVKGYEASTLIDVVYAKTVALAGSDIPNQTGAERSMLAVLLAARTVGSEPLRVLDFGGACGFHYRAASLVHVPLRWAVVESTAMAAKASKLGTNDLKFFDSIGDAARWLGGVDLMFSSSALQYVHNSNATLSELLALKAPLIVWSRMPMVDGPSFTETQSSRLADNGPGPLPAGFEDTEVHYTVSYLSIEPFLAAHSGYKLLFRSGELSSSAFVFRHDRG